MDGFSRRAFMAGAIGATMFAAGCGNGIGSDGASSIDARVDQTIFALERQSPDVADLRAKAVGELVMPLITEAGFGLGGSYGRGALRINGTTVDYYSASQASFGLQIGGQQYSHVLLFMTQDSLQDFRTSAGWVAGADLEYALNDGGENLSTDTTVLDNPVIPIIFGQAGLLAGATIEGTKYTRIIP
ncbi:MAG: YSC84-related protein [Pseudomonadota bacterium]